MLQLEDVDVLAVPAYTPGKKFHPQENGWLGYVFTLDRVTYYHAGDTGYLDSMATIRCDVAYQSRQFHCSGEPGGAAPDEQHVQRHRVRIRGLLLDRSVDGNGRLVPGRQHGTADALLVHIVPCCRLSRADYPAIRTYLAGQGVR
jgi:hypothetical protein